MTGEEDLAATELVGRDLAVDVTLKVLLAMVARLSRDTTVEHMRTAALEVIKELRAGHSDPDFADPLARAASDRIDSIFGAPLSDNAPDSDR